MSRPSPIRDQMIAALVARFRPGHGRDWHGPFEPEAGPADYACTMTYRAADGHNSIGTLSFGEVVDALLAADLATTPEVTCPSCSATIRARMADPL
jgi:hypothetical protein